MHLRLFAVAHLFAVVAAACAQVGPSTAPADMPKIPLADFDRDVLATSDSHVLWYSSELIESTRRNRVQSFTLRYYLQAVGEADASLIHQEVVHGRIPRGFILADGSVAILMGNVLWIEPKTSEKRYEDPLLDGHRAEMAGIPIGNIVRADGRYYHNGVGFIHCGTNVVRELPTDKWWEH